jgi:hypothetical protein
MTGAEVARLLDACEQWVTDGMPGNEFPPALAELSQPDRDKVLGGVRELVQALRDRLAELNEGREAMR